MKKLFVPVFLLVGSSCAAQVQLVTPGMVDDAGNAPQGRDSAANSTAKPAFVYPYIFPAAGALFQPGVTNAAASFTALSTTAGAAEPRAASPEPKYLYGSRDDYRFQLGLGLSLFRFQNSIFTATAIGTKTSVTYFLNEWFAVEGNVSAAFAPQIFVREHVKTVLYGGGPKIAWRRKNWEPWLHGIVGGAHEQPQTAAGGRNAFGIQLGGGGDYRINPRVSARLSGDFVRTTFFGQTQNNYEANAGIVLHF